MIPEWYSAGELAGLTGMPSHVTSVRAMASRERWQSRKRAKGKGLEYHFSGLPEATRAALTVRHLAPVAKPAAAAVTSEFVAAAWHRWERSTQHLRDRADNAAQALRAVEALVRGGMPVGAARKVVATQWRGAGRICGLASLGRWAAAVAGAHPQDYAALLVPEYTGSTCKAAYDSRAEDYFQSTYLSRSQPSFAECWRRTQEVARHNGWTLPSEKTAIRWLKDKVDLVAMTAARRGIAAAVALHPMPRRDESVFEAGDAVNGDGLKFDKLWVKFDDGEIINTATGWFWQDVASRKILAYRLGKTESTDLFRLSTYDLTRVCAPTVAYVDNTRVAANKLMTAGAQHRNRFTKKGEDGQGLMPAIGIDLRFTDPDKVTGSKGSRPVERSFGIGGIHSKVATNPEIVALGGFSKAKAIPFELFARVVAQEVARHNAQEGRLNRAAGGVMSLDETWMHLTAGKVMRMLSEAQRRQLLLVRECCLVRSMRVRIGAGKNSLGTNVYTASDLARYEGRKVFVHFDPENLHAGAFAYSLGGDFLMSLEHMPTHAFNDKAAGDEVAKRKARIAKMAKRATEEHRAISDREAAAMYGAATRDTLPAAPVQTTAKVIGGLFKAPLNPGVDALKPYRTEDGDWVDLETGEIVQFADGSLTEHERRQQRFIDLQLERQKRQAL